eukprot:Nk52_evm49s2391 gene=Nk52_evmTU49s2391
MKNFVRGNNKNKKSDCPTIGSSLAASGAVIAAAGSTAAEGGVAGGGGGAGESLSGGVRRANSIRGQVEENNFSRSHSTTSGGGMGLGGSGSGGGAGGEGDIVVEGWLNKWTNYLKGHRERWFVLNRSLLSYYRSKEEMGHTCRGTINIYGAVVTFDKLSITISTGTQFWHLKAQNDTQLAKWKKAFELARKYDTPLSHSQNDSPDEDEEEENALSDEEEILVGDAEVPSLELKEANKDVRGCTDAVIAQVTGLQRLLSALNDNVLDTNPELQQLQKELGKFKMSANAMGESSSNFMQLIEKEEAKWHRMLKAEVTKRTRLEQTVEQLAQQHNTLERRASLVGRGMNIKVSDKGELLADDDERVKKSLKDGGEGGPGVSDDEEDAFFDAPEYSDFDKSHVELGLSRKATELSLVKNKKVYRSTVPNRSTKSYSLWPIMKNCIGKDLSKIPMPVFFNEPLSFLQRLSEDIEYSDLLHKAAECESSLERMTYVAAFTMSSYCTTTIRTGKPFNPMLGETFELDRLMDDDLGIRVLTEQVSHHPPISAMIAECDEWAFYEEFSMKSKFRGKYLQIVPTGHNLLIFKKTGEKYTWEKVTTTVHNIIVGKLWIDQSGKMEIKNHSKNEVCKLTYHAYSYFSSQTPRSVDGVVMDAESNVHYVLDARWDEMCCRRRPDEPKEKNELIWQRHPLHENYQKIYGFGKFACSLNEPDPEVCPTDSRFRPDQRLMEEGDWDSANEEKTRLEDKQRQVRKVRESRGLGQPDPKWFRKTVDKTTGTPYYEYVGGYWEAKKARSWKSIELPDIF